MIENNNNFILRGCVLYSSTPEKLITFDDAYVVCKDGVSEGVFTEIPDEFKDFPIRDERDCLIIPGLTDLHTHAPQYTYRGNGYDKELLDWLNTYTFPEESKYKDPLYAEDSYRMFTEELRKSFTTRACIFGTAYAHTTIRLMEMLEESGLITLVGKVNMDRNVPDYYVETTEGSVSATRDFVSKVKDRGFKNTGAIITPRFTPSCTRELLTELSKIAEEFDLPVQSHLSENRSEIAWVKELEPDTSCYADSYLKAGLIGKNRPCIMAHCVWSDENEQRLLKENNVFIAHSPESNMNISSGAAPVKKYLYDGQKAGLATDVAGGSTLSMLSAMKSALHSSKLRFALFDEKLPPLTFPEAFYLATKGGGEFFGTVGSFEKGYSFDALILDDSSIKPSRGGASIEERAERFMYLGNEGMIKGKYVAGKKII